MVQSFSERVREIIRSIPRGRVATYGQIATYAGNPRAVRQVVWTLHSCSEADGLPWHRVINREGRISLPKGGGFEEQRFRLEQEGVFLDLKGRIPLDTFLWEPSLEEAAQEEG